MRVLLLLVLTSCSTDTFGGDAGSDAAIDVGPCPSEQGFYGFTYSGAGCTANGASDTACITQLGCNITITSTLPSDLNTMVGIDMSGGFAGGSVQEQTQARTGCTGVWSGNTLTIDCGGFGTGQSCRAILMPAKGSCPP